MKASEERAWESEDGELGGDRGSWGRVTEDSQSPL